MPIFTFWLKDCDSCWVSDAMMVIRISTLASIVFIDSFSNMTGIFMSLSSLMYFRQSIVFQANRLIDLVIIISILPALLLYCFSHDCCSDYSG